MLPIPEPFITSELDFHRERLREDFAAAELRRRNRAARRRARHHGMPRGILRRELSPTDGVG